jgi:hypothetical protein
LPWSSTATIVCSGIVLIVIGPISGSIYTRSE